MRKAPAAYIPLLLSLYLFCTAERCQYDASPVLLNNVFRFTGSRISAIGGNTRPNLYAISLAKTTPGYLTLAPRKKQPQNKSEKYENTYHLLPVRPQHCLLQRPDQSGSQRSAGRL